MTTLYVCGDSFCSDDPDYPGGWLSEFQKQHNNLEIISLASPGASNFQIYLQVKEALDKHCDYLIYHATSSIRYEFIVDHFAEKEHGYKNFWNRSEPTQARKMLCTSWVTPENSLCLTDKQVDTIKQFYKNFVDLDTEIEKNYLFICATLDLIASKKIKNWVWSRGGFEHKSFLAGKNWKFAYSEQEAEINLWDYYDSSEARPFYHISNLEIIKTACKCYSNMLNLLQ
jgi:hypothetical protein